MPDQAPKTLFISDLHLDRERPGIVTLFAEFIDKQARDADALYILGDLFEYWVGDDQPTHGLEPAIEALQSLKSVTPVFFIQGNRDFLVSDGFAQRTGLKLLPDSVIIDLYDRTALLLHGDTLCSDDVDYQQLRELLRDSAWQQQFLSQPVSDRLAQALALREKSMAETSGKTEAIMDVNQQRVEAELRKHRANLMIHGHTHRPGRHRFELDGEPVERIVLGDWYQKGNVLIVTPDDLILEDFDTPV